MTRASLWIAVAMLVGIAAAVWALGRVDLGQVWQTMQHIGIGGFLFYCLYTIGGFFLLGGAWLAAMPGEGIDRLPLFAWGRAVREAVSDLLPFSQIGGIVVSTRSVAAGGYPLYRVYAALIVDMTTELASQLAFTLFGVASVALALSDGPAADRLRPLLLAGVAVLVAIVVAVFGAQHLLLRFAARLAQTVLPGSVATIEAIGGELRAIYARRDRVALALGFNLAAWTYSATGAWIVLYLMDVRLPLASAIAIESLIFTLRSVAFAIPGGIGVQEAAYALAGPVLGLPPEAALALALAKRARDIGIGLPTLLLWQVGQARAFVRG